MNGNNDVKFTNTESTNQLRQARGGNICNQLATDDVIVLIKSENAHIIGFIEHKPEGKLPKVICCDVHGARSLWLFALAKDAENCQEGVPYLFKIEAIRYNRDDTPYLMVRPVTLLSAELMDSERFGNLIAQTNRFPLYWARNNSTEWNYAPLCERLGLPEDTNTATLCKHAADQALAGNISFEEIVELIYLPESFLENLATSFGGAAPVVKTSNSSNLKLLTPSSNKPKRKRTCKGKKYKEPRQKSTPSTNTSEKSAGGKNKKKDNGAKGKKGK